MNSIASDTHAILCVLSLEDVCLDLSYPGNGEGKAALVFAAEKGHVEVLEVLLSNGADVNQGQVSCVAVLFCSALKRGTFESV